MKILFKKVRQVLTRMFGNIKSYFYTIYFLWHNRIKNKYYVCSRGIGDTAIFLSHLKIYYKKNKKKVNLIIAENQRVLINPYQEYVEKIIVLKTSQVNLLTNAIWDNKIFSSKLEFILPSHASNLLDSGGNLFDLTGRTLGIKSLDYDAPDFSYIDIDSVFVDDLKNLKGSEYVFLAPDSVSVSSIEMGTWEKIVRICKKQGFSVVQNGNINNVNKLGDVGVFKAIDETYLIARNARLIISARSGLSDLLAFAKTPMIVIYPDKNSLDEYSFKRMPFSNHVNEFITDDTLLKKMEEIICH